MVVGYFCGAWYGQRKFNALKSGLVCLYEVYSWVKWWRRHSIALEAEKIMLTLLTLMGRCNLFLWWASSACELHCTVKLQDFEVDGILSIAGPGVSATSLCVDMSLEETSIRSPLNGSVMGTIVRNGATNVGHQAC